MERTSPPHSLEIREDGAVHARTALFDFIEGLYNNW